MFTLSLGFHFYPFNSLFPTISFHFRYIQSDTFICTLGKTQQQAPSLLARPRKSQTTSFPIFPSLLLMVYVPLHRPEDSHHTLAWLSAQLVHHPFPKHYTNELTLFPHRPIWCGREAEVSQLSVVTPSTLHRGREIIAGLKTSNICFLHPNAGLFSSLFLF